MFALQMIVVMGAVAIAAQAAVSFEAPRNYQVGGVDAIAVADFNGDGKADLATVSYDRGVTILLGDGKGGFRIGAAYKIGLGGLSITTGDFNLDGRLDLAVAGAGQGVSILLGNGDGTFQPVASYADATTPEFVTAGDFNGDGRLDLALGGNHVSSSISILLGNGDGTFQAAVDYPVPEGTISLAVGDFNRDGKLDIAAASAYQSSVAILAGNGDGSFAPFVSYASGPNSQFVQAADLNGDGNLDLVVVNVGASSAVSVLLGNGDGSFLPPVSYPVREYALSVAVSDFTGDGRLDVAVGSTVGGNSSGPGLISVLRGNGDGTLQAATEYRDLAVPYYLAAADFNRDGSADLAVSESGYIPNRVGRISILTNRGKGTFEGSGYALSDPASKVAAGGFHNDGKLDLVAGSAQGVEMLRGNGDATFRDAVRVATAQANLAMAAADFNGDGNLDLATLGGKPGSTNTSISILLGNGHGGFLVAAKFACGACDSLAVGDFNGDGYADLAIALEDGIAIYLGNGDGTFRSAPGYGTRGFHGHVVIADFNGDGKLDLAADGCCFGTVWVLLGNGDGTFQQPVAYAANTRGGPLAAADCNGDGNMDLIQASDDGQRGAGLASNGIAVLLGNGDGTFQAAIPYRADTFAHSIAVGDFDGDGKADVAVTGPIWGSVSILPGKGDGSFLAHVDFGAGYDPDDVVVGDFNGDGRPDLAVWGGKGSLLWVLVNRSR